MPDVNVSLMNKVVALGSLQSQRQTTTQQLVSVPEVDTELLKRFLYLQDLTVKFNSVSSHLKVLPIVDPAFIRNVVSLDSAARKLSVVHNDLLNTDREYAVIRDELKGVGCPMYTSGTCQFILGGSNGNV
jgi:hypothetical protein